MSERTGSLPALFEAIFPGLEAGEATVYRAALAVESAGRMVIDLGCGAGRLTHWLAGPDGVAGTVVGVEIGAAWARVAGAKGLSVVRGDFRSLPFRDASAGGMVSGLLSLNYAGTESEFRSALREAARVLREGGALVAEIAAAWRPRELQGLTECAAMGDGRRFEFFYYDVLEESEQGVSIATEMQLAAGGEEASDRAVMFVPALAALPQMIAEAGMQLVAMYAPYDVASRTLEPPDDTLRVIFEARGVGR